MVTVRRGSGEAIPWSETETATANEDHGKIEIDPSVAHAGMMMTPRIDGPIMIVTEDESEVQTGKKRAGGMHMTATIMGGTVQGIIDVIMSIPVDPGLGHPGGRTTEITVAGIQERGPLRMTGAVNAQGQIHDMQFPFKCTIWRF